MINCYNNPAHSKLGRIVYFLFILSLGAGDYVRLFGVRVQFITLPLILFIMVYENGGRLRVEPKKKRAVKKL